MIEHTLKKTKQKEQERQRRKKEKSQLIINHPEGSESDLNDVKKYNHSKKKIKNGKKNGKNGKKKLSKPQPQPQPNPAKTASSSASFSFSSSNSLSASILNLPDLEPRKKPISEDSVSSMSVTPDQSQMNIHGQMRKKTNGKKRKLIQNLIGKNGHNQRQNKKRKLNNNNSGLKIIDNDVIGDSDEDEEETKTQITSKSKSKSKQKQKQKQRHTQKEPKSEKTTITAANGVGTRTDTNNHQDELEEIEMEDFEISHSLIYEITLDDFKFSFFLSLFPQLFVTHHLVYCQNSYHHYYYQNYNSSIDNKYEWIQTDIQLMDIYHRYIENHFVTNKIDYNIINQNKYNDFKNRKIVLFFQIRPRSDTESDEETIEYHKQLLMDNLIQINKFRKNNQNQKQNESTQQQKHEKD